MRIKIDSNKRALFFEDVKSMSSISWEDMRKNFSFSRTTFDRYRSGELLIPEDVFSYLLDFLDSPTKRMVLSSIKKFPDNFGRVKGGKIAYKTNFDKFVEGRKKGMAAIGRIRDARTISFENFELTSDVCEFIGAFIGDGMFNCYKNKLYQVEFACDKRYDLDYYNGYIIPAVNKICENVRPHFYKSSKRENAYRVVFYSKKLFLFLKDFCGFVPGRKARTVKIPNFLFKDKRFLKRVIRGIFDTDGGVFLDRRVKYKSYYPRIIFTTISKSLFDQLNLYLSKEFNLYTNYNLERNAYVIEIYGKVQLKKWMSLVGFSNKRHLDKIALVAQ